MDDLPLASKLVLYHIRDTTLSAGPVRRRARYSLSMPIGVTLAALALLYFAARAFL